MPTTVPDGIETPDVGWTGGFIQAMITMADTIQDIFSRKAANSYSWANDTARNAQTGMAQGDTGTQTDIGVQFLYDGTRWNPTGVSASDTPAARDLRIPVGQRKQGMKVLARDAMIVWTYFELYNVSTNPGGANVAGWYPDTLYCVLRKTTNQNLTTSAAALVLDSEASDLGGMHDNVTNNTRIQLPLPGTYMVTAFLYNNNTTGMGSAYGRINGTTDVVGSIDRRTGDANAGTPLRLTFPVVVVSPADYLEIMVLHATAAGTISSGTNNLATTVTVARVGP